MKYSFNVYEKDHPESSVEKNIKRHLQACDMLFGTFHDNKRHISVLRFEKKGQNPTNWWKVLDILVAIHFRFRWTKFLWTVAVRKEVMAGGLMKGEETVGPEAVDPRMHRWGTWRDRWGSWGVQGAEMVWLNCLFGTKGGDISVICLDMSSDVIYLDMSFWCLIHSHQCDMQLV